MPVSRRTRRVLLIVIPAVVGALAGLLVGPVVGAWITESPDSLESGFEGFLYGLYIGPAAGALIFGFVGALIGSSRDDESSA